MTSRKTRNLRYVDGKYYLDFTYKGRRVRKFGGFTREQAQLALARERLDRRDIALGLKQAPVEDVEFSRFADEFLELYSKQNKRSWRRDEISIAHLKDFFEGETLRSLGPEKIERFKAARRAEVSNSTVNRECACLKTILSKAVEWGKLEVSPAARIKKLKEPPSRERILAPDEIARLLAAASPELRPVLVIALGTGMRRGEILGLKWADVDLVRGIITLRTSKSGKGRQVPMSGAVAAALGGVTGHREYVFHNPETGRPIRDVKTAFAGACRRAKKNPQDPKDQGITGARFHDLRHTFASRALELGADIMTVSKILGHTSIQMTAKYLHPTGETMRLAVEKAGELLEPTRQKADRVAPDRPVSIRRCYN